MSIKDLILNMQLEGLTEASFNGLDGSGVARVLKSHRHLWTMLYFGHDELFVFPTPGGEEALSSIFSFSRGDEEETASIYPDECSWEEVDGKRYIRAWWD